MEEQAFEALNEVLAGGQPWEKVHAAEFLIDLGKVDVARDVFMVESNENGHIPEYRIGIWRVLYKCTGEEERQAWRDSICRSFVLPESPDRIHAVETLAKLKIPAEKTDSGVIGSAMASTDYRLVVYTQWWAIPQVENGIEKLKEHLFKTIGSGSDNPARRLAAYVLSEDRDICLNAEEWQSLENLAMSEPVDSDVRLQLLAAAFSKASADPGNIKKLLMEYKDSEKPDLYQLCLALARNGDIEDTDILEPLLGHPENDVRIAAAYAILKINNSK